MEQAEIIQGFIAIIYGFCMFVVGYIVGHADGKDYE